MKMSFQSLKKQKQNSKIFIKQNLKNSIYFPSIENISNKESSIKSLNVFRNSQGKLNKKHDKNLLFLYKNKNNAKESPIFTTAKSVRFKQRISIQDSNFLQNYKKKLQKRQQQISKSFTCQVFNNLAQNYEIAPLINTRKQYSQNLRLINYLLNSSVLSKNTALNQLKCLMCHYYQHHSQLFDRKIIKKAKQKVLKHINHENQKFSFKYDIFQHFLQNLLSNQYDSHLTINSFQTLLSKYYFPLSIRLMFYYLAFHLYLFNSQPHKSQSTLLSFLQDILQNQLYEYLGIYLLLIIKLKSNQLQWESSTKYLQKLLIYSWLYKYDNLQIWTYFQLSRSQFFCNNEQEAKYFQNRSEMSIIQSTENVYRQLLVNQFVKEIQQMKLQRKGFNLNSKISTHQLMKINHNQQNENNKDIIKIQSEIKNIREHCKIKHVKNLIKKIKINKKFSSIISNQRSSFFKNDYQNKENINSPILRTHESPLKNLNVFFRNSLNQQNKRKQPQLYTFQNSTSNITFLKQICRNVLLQMKWLIPLEHQKN